MNQDKIEDQLRIHKETNLFHEIIVLIYLTSFSEE
jgi:hypothetical protein